MTKRAAAAAMARGFAAQRRALWVRDGLLLLAVVGVFLGFFYAAFGQHFLKVSPEEQEAPEHVVFLNVTKSPDDARPPSLRLGDALKPEPRPRRVPRPAPPQDDTPSWPTETPPLPTGTVYAVEDSPIFSSPSTGAQVVARSGPLGTPILYRNYAGGWIEVVNDHGTVRGFMPDVGLWNQAIIGPPPDRRTIRAQIKNSSKEPSTFLALRDDLSVDTFGGTVCWYYWLDFQCNDEALVLRKHTAEYWIRENQVLNSRIVPH